MDKALVVAVSRDSSTIFAAWRHDASVQSGLFGALALGMALGLFFYQRRQREYLAERERMNAALRETSEEWDRFFSMSIDLLCIADICALIACSRVYCGSSLHGRIVAMAFALARISLIYPDPANRLAKQAAFAATWEKAGMPATASVNEIAHGIRHALSVDPGQLQQIAGELVGHYRHGFYVICAELKDSR